MKATIASNKISVVHHEYENREFLTFSVPLGRCEETAQQSAHLRRSGLCSQWLG